MRKCYIWAINIYKFNKMVVKQIAQEMGYAQINYVFVKTSITY